MVLVNSGVLFYSSKPSGELVFLLGQERFIEGYRCSGEWSAFEGGVKDGETELQTAVRECAEESNGVVLRSSRVLDKLQTRSFKVTMKLVDEETDGCSADRSLFVVQVPYEDTIPARFAAQRAKLEELLQMVRQYDRLRLRAQKLGLPRIGYEHDGVHLADIFHCHINKQKELWVHSMGVHRGVFGQRMQMVQVDSAQEKFVGGLQADDQAVVAHSNRPLSVPSWS